MGPKRGQVWIDEKLNLLRRELANYFGQLNEIKAGIRPKEITEKPEALALYELCEMTGLPLVKGSLLDQPHIWLQEYVICRQESIIFGALQNNPKD